MNAKGESVSSFKEEPTLQMQPRVRRWGRIFGWKRAKLDEQAKQSVVQLVYTRGKEKSVIYGSATYIGAIDRQRERWGIFLTTDHLFQSTDEEPKQVHVIFKGANCNGQVIRRPPSSQKDVAIIEINSADLQKLKHAGLKAPRLDFSQKIQGVVRLIGFPAAEQPHAFQARGEIKGDNTFKELKFQGDVKAQKYFRIESPYEFAEEGWSGGAVCHKGSVFAIIAGRTGGASNRRIALTLSFGIPLEDFVESFPDRVGPFKPSWRCPPGFPLILALIIVLVLGVKAVPLMRERLVSKIGDNKGPVSQTLAKPEIVTVAGQRVIQRKVNLIANSASIRDILKGEFVQGNYESGNQITALFRRRGERIQCSGPAKVDKKGWEIPISFEVPKDSDSTMFELVPIFARERPMKDIQTFEMWRKGNGVVTIVLKIASLTIDSIQLAGAYANIIGRAKNLPDETLIEFKTSRIDGLGSSEAGGMPKAVIQDRWSLNQVPVRGLYEPGGDYEVRVMASAKANAEYGFIRDIESNPVQVSVLKPMAPITGCFLQKKPRPRISGLIAITGTVQNVRRDENVAVVVFGYNAAGETVGRWWGLIQKPNGRWSTNVEVTDGVYFDVYATLSPEDPGEDKSQLGKPTQCR